MWSAVCLWSGYIKSGLFVLGVSICLWCATVSDFYVYPVWAFPDSQIGKFSAIISLYIFPLWLHTLDHLIKFRRSLRLCSFFFFKSLFPPHLKLEWYPSVFCSSNSFCTPVCSPVCCLFSRSLQLSAFSSLVPCPAFSSCFSHPHCDHWLFSTVRLQGSA